MTSITITTKDITSSENITSLKDVVPFLETFCQGKTTFRTNTDFNKILATMVYENSFKEKIKGYHYMWYKSGNKQALVLFRAPSTYIFKMNLKRIFNETPLNEDGKIHYSEKYREYKVFSALVKFTYNMTNPPPDNKKERLGVFWLDCKTIDKIVQNDSKRTKYNHVLLNKVFEKSPKTQNRNYFVQPDFLDKLDEFKMFNTDSDIKNKSNRSDSDESDEYSMQDLWGDSDSDD